MHNGKFISSSFLSILDRHGSDFKSIKRNMEMSTDFKAGGLPALIGSLPMSDHKKAVNIVLEYTPEIPLWVQLPTNKNEGMMVQFLSGFPGLTTKGDKTYIDTDGESFQSDLLTFYEEYIAVTEGGTDISDTRFTLAKETAAGFFELMEQLDTHAPSSLYALKGQITGPITLGTGLTDQNDRAIFYDDQVRDAVIKILALKAAWQVRQLSTYNLPVIIFFDEPSLTGFGSSAFISISKEEIAACFDEVIEAVHKEGGLTGIHVCGNTEWSLLLDSKADIISFDAYSYFDKFILYKDQIKHFITRGGILAWGIVPSLNAEDLEKETCSSLTDKWEQQVSRIEALGIDRSKIIAQSLITPSCGTGSLNLKMAIKAIRLTQEVSKKVQLM